MLAFASPGFVNPWRPLYGVGRIQTARVPQPVLKLPRSRAENVVDGLTAIMLLASFGVALWYWPGLPVLVPLHFNAAGKVDGWGAKSTVWLLPVVGVVLALFLTVLSRFSHTFNYPCAITPENAEPQYRMARLLLGIVKLSAVVNILHARTDGVLGCLRAEHSRRLVSRGDGRRLLRHHHGIPHISPTRAVMKDGAQRPIGRSAFVVGLGKNERSGNP